MPTREYTDLIDLGYSEGFLKTPAGSPTSIRRQILFMHHSEELILDVYRCKNCFGDYVKTMELPDPVLNNPTNPDHQRDFRFRQSSAQSSGFCCNGCVGEDDEVQGLSGDRMLQAAELAERPDFYETKEWRKVRYNAIKKYCRTCQCCGSQSHPIHVDHIKSRFFFPYFALDINNLQILCADCNIGKGYQDDTDWRGKK
jgi:hypothetical protein